MIVQYEYSLTDKEIFKKCFLEILLVLLPILIIIVFYIIDIHGSQFENLLIVPFLMRGFNCYIYFPDIISTEISKYK